MAASAGGYNWKEAKKRLEAERAKYGGKTRGEILEDFLSSGMTYKKAIDAAWELEDMLSSGVTYKKAIAAVWEKLEIYKNTLGGEYNETS